MMKWVSSKAVWAAVGLLILAVVDFLNGNTETAVQRLCEALSIVGIRHGIWKTGQ